MILPVKVLPVVIACKSGQASCDTENGASEFGRQREVCVYVHCNEFKVFIMKIAFKYHNQLFVNISKRSRFRTETVVFKRGVAREPVSRHGVLVNNESGPPLDTPRRATDRHLCRLPFVKRLLRDLRRKIHFFLARINRPMIN